MISIISGVILLAAGGAGIWYFKPHNGKVHWHAEVPVLDSMIPIAIVGLLAIAVAMTVSGVSGLLT